MSYCVFVLFVKIGVSNEGDLEVDNLPFQNRTTNGHI